MSGLIGGGPRVLVTGAAGFLGSHLCDMLLSGGAEVVGLDSLFSGSRTNLAHLRGHERFDFVLHDVTAPFQAEVGRIYNLACPASPIHYQFDPVHTLKTSFNGALNMLGLACRTKARILQASTSEVYGDPAVSPQAESYFGNVNTWGPRACYDEGKRAAEALFHAYRERRGVDARAVRIFNTYGPRMRPDDGRVVSNIITQALTGKPITVYGDGSHTRSFCYVEDLVDAIVKAMEADSLDAPVNLGNPDEITIGELAEIIIEMTGSASRVELKPLPQDDPLQRRPDISRAARALDWTPTTPLRDGLARTIEYFEGVLCGRAGIMEAAE